MSITHKRLKIILGVFIFCWFLVMFYFTFRIIINDRQAQIEENERTQSKFTVEIGDNKYEHCTYENGCYFTEKGGIIYFEKQAHVITKEK